VSGGGEGISKSKRRFDQVFEDADVFYFHKLDSRRLVRLVTVDEAVDREVG
jgi:hypothetical protein